MDEKWIKRFLIEAKNKAHWSKDPSTKVGSIIVGDHKQIISTGYNGFPRGINDSPEIYADKEKKYARVTHAEMNAIYNASLTGVSLNGATLFVSNLPVCHECAKGIIQVGIKEVYMLFDLNIASKWAESFKLTGEFFEEAGIKAVCYRDNPDFYADIS